MANLIDRHRDQIAGVLLCYDRVVIRGTLPSVCHAQAMATTLDARGIRLFDYPKLFAEPLRDAIKRTCSTSLFRRIRRGCGRNTSTHSTTRSRSGGDTAGAPRRKQRCAGSSPRTTGAHMKTRAKGGAGVAEEELEAMRVLQEAEANANGRILAGAVERKIWKRTR